MRSSVSISSGLILLREGPGSKHAKIPLATYPARRDAPSFEVRAATMRELKSLSCDSTVRVVAAL